MRVLLSLYSMFPKPAQQYAFEIPCPKFAQLGQTFGGGRFLLVILDHQFISPFEELELYGTFIVSLV